MTTALVGLWLENDFKDPNLKDISEGRAQSQNFSPVEGRKLLLLSLTFPAITHTSDELRHQELPVTSYSINKPQTAWRKAITNLGNFLWISLHHFFKGSFCAKRYRCRQTANIGFLFLPTSNSILLITCITNNMRKLGRVLMELGRAQIKCTS